MASVPDLEEELSTVSAVLCRNMEELEIYQKGYLTGDPTKFMMKIQVPSATADNDFGNSSMDHFLLNVHFTLQPDYPNTTPQINICRTKNFNAAYFQSELEHHCNSLPIGQPMLLQILFWIQEKASEFIKIGPKANNENSATVESEFVASDSNYILMYCLDHMRAQKKYLKTLVSWAEDLNVRGSIVFGWKKILVVLVGPEMSVKTFITRQRTEYVDIDVKGKPCKERLLKILYESNVDNTKFNIPGKLEVKEFSMPSEVPKFLLSTFDISLEHP